MNRSRLKLKRKLYALIDLSRNAAGIDFDEAGNFRIRTLDGSVAARGAFDQLSTTGLLDPRVHCYNGRDSKESATGQNKLTNGHQENVCDVVTETNEVVGEKPKAPCFTSLPTQVSRGFFWLQDGILYHANPSSVKYGEPLRR